MESDQAGFHLGAWTVRWWLSPDWTVSSTLGTEGPRVRPHDADQFVVTGTVVREPHSDILRFDRHDHRRAQFVGIRKRRTPPHLAAAIEFGGGPEVAVYRGELAAQAVCRSHELRRVGASGRRVDLGRSTRWTIRPSFIN